jgi:protein involved in polysaccharide export with SLBB domain
MFSKSTPVTVAMILLLIGSTIAAAQTSGTRGTEKRVDEDAVDQQRTIQQQQEQILRLQAQVEEAKRMAGRGLDAPVDPDTYVLGPADELVLVLRGQVQRDVRLTVLPEGVVILPNYGAYPVAGMTVTQFRNEVKAHLDRYYKNVEFHCQLVATRRFVVYVLGDVVDPGAVELHAPFRVNVAIEGARGLSQNGTRRFIQIRENGTVVREVDLFSFLNRGDVDQNPVLKEGQSVYVPAKHTTAVVLGEVWNPSTFEVRPGETVADVIQFAGGPTNYADFEHIVVESYDRSSHATINYYTYEQLDSVAINNRDIVVLPDRRTFNGGDYVELRGGGSRQGKVYIEKGETLSSFIPRFARLSDNHDLERAVVERESEDGSVKYITVDFERLLAGDEEADIPLQKGDIISVPLMDNYVYVSGEVVNPGQIEFQRGLPAERYIALAGGPTRAGSINKIRIYSTDGTNRSGDRNSTVYRGDTVLLERTFTSYAGPMFVAFTSLTSLVLSVIAVSK